MVATSRKKEGVCVCVCGALMAEEEEQPQKRRGGELEGGLVVDGCFVHQILEYHNRI